MKAIVKVERLVTTTYTLELGAKGQQLTAEQISTAVEFMLTCDPNALQGQRTATELGSPNVRQVKRAK